MNYLWMLVTAIIAGMLFQRTVENSILEIQTENYRSTLESYVRTVAGTASPAYTCRPIRRLANEE